MQKWYSATPELVRVGDTVRIYNRALECYCGYEVLKVCPKTFLIMKFDEKKQAPYPAYVAHSKVGIIPREVTLKPETPERLCEISAVWSGLAARSESTGYATLRAGFYFVYDSKLWFLYAPGDREGRYLPHVNEIERRLRSIGATEVEFDEGELD